MSKLALLLVSSALGVAFAQPTEWERYVPKGYTLEGVTRGDLNGDGRSDAALKLLKTGSEDGARALLVLVQTSSGGYVRAGLGEKILACRNCGGAFYGIGNAPADLKIEKGVLVISQEHGSRAIQSYLLRLRWDAAAQKFALIGLDFANQDRLDGTRQTASYNLLTGKKILETFAPDANGNLKKLSLRSSASDLPRQWLEQVDYDALQMKLEN